MEMDLKGVQDAYQQLLADAQAQFEANVKSATDTMQQMLKQAAQEQAPPPAPDEPEAKAMDGGVWLNKAAMDLLLQVIDKIAVSIDEMQKQQTNG